MKHPHAGVRVLPQYKAKDWQITGKKPRINEIVDTAGVKAFGNSIPINIWEEIDWDLKTPIWISIGKEMHIRNSGGRTYLVSTYPIKEIK